MLNWLKRRARVTINSRYVSILRRNINSDEMFVAEPVQCNVLFNHSLKLVVVSSDGRDYSLEVPTDMTVERVNKMAVGHFFNPQEAVGSEGEGGTALLHPGYRLVLVREARPLDDANSVQLEQLLDNDELLLVKKRVPPVVQDLKSEKLEAPTKVHITAATQNLPRRNSDRDPDAAYHTVDFQTEFRRILVTMIEASVRLISAEPESEEIFTQILDKLERRHRPHVDRTALRQLTEMGFPEARATRALQVKKTVMEAMEWLLEQGNMEGSVGEGVLGVSSSSPSTTSPPSASTNNGVPQDPAQKILNTFLQYRKKWFQPNTQALQDLLLIGFKEEDIIDALRVTGNKKSLACELLLQGKPITLEDQGLDRDSPVIAAILASPVIQLALPKPKTLLALMMLYENPNNANMWLSDPDTHPVVSQVIRIYHAEKHSLIQSRGPLPSASSAPESSSSSSSTPTSTSSASSHVLNVRGGSSEVVGNNQQPIYAGWLSSSSSISPHLRSSTSSPIPTPRSDPSVAPSPAAVLRVTVEEPMSHSGSPIRGPGGLLTSDVPNGITRELTMTLVPSPGTGQSQVQVLAYHEQASQPPQAHCITTSDVEMDEASTEAQDMDTQ